MSYWQHQHESGIEDRNSLTGITMFQMFQGYLDGFSLMSTGAMTATMGGDRNCSTNAAARCSSVTDQKSAETETKLHAPLSSRKPGLQ